MPELDLDVRNLLDRWALAPAQLASSLTVEAVRAEDRAVLALQRSPGELHSIEDLVASTEAGPVPVRVYRPRAGRSGTTP